MYVHDNTLCNTKEPADGVSAIYTGWKHVIVERDKMCRRGGMIWEDGSPGNPGKEPDVQAGDLEIYLAKNPDGTRADNVVVGDIITIFDTQTPYESAADTACAMALDTVSDPRWVKITLGDVATCTQPYQIQNPLGYDGSVPNPSFPDPKPWDFTIGKSAGVCVEGPGYYEADTSQLNKQDKTGPFDDAFTSFYVSPSGQNVVPRLPSTFFTGEMVLTRRTHYHQLWFANKNPKTCWIEGQNCADCCNKHWNYFHVIGSDMFPGQSDSTTYESDLSMVFRHNIEDQVISYCSDPGPPPVNCVGDELTNYVRYITAHELAHQFNVNPNCTPFFHDTNYAWCGNPAGGVCLSTRPECQPTTQGEWCTMNGTTTPFVTAICQRADGIDRFDCQDLSLYPTLCPLSPPQGDCSGGNNSIRLTKDTDTILK